MKLTLAILRAYKRWLSPLLPPSCRYTPTCSEYAMEAVATHGVMRGTIMATWRLLRCNPLSKGGYDPVKAPGACAHLAMHDGIAGPSPSRGVVQG